jgi:hypothetical protein
VESQGEPGESQGERQGESKGRAFKMLGDRQGTDGVEPGERWEKSFWRACSPLSCYSITVKVSLSGGNRFKVE